MSVKTSPGKRDGAVRRILAGESTVENEARKLRISVQAVRRFVTLARKGEEAPKGPLPFRDRGDGNARAPGPADEGARGLGGSNGSTPRLDRALSSAGIGEIDDAPTPDGDDEQAPIPALDGEKLLAFAQTVRSIGLRVYAGFLGVDTNDKRAIEIFDMGEEEKKTLALWAPDAAVYFGPHIAFDGAIGAWTFAGLYVAGMWGATGRIKALAPIVEKPERVQGPTGSAPMVPVNQEPLPRMQHGTLPG